MIWQKQSAPATLLWSPSHLEGRPLTLLQQCGLDPLPKRKARTTWLQARLHFLGAERYVLGTKYCEVSLRANKQGFGLQFKQPIQLLADQLLGPSIPTGRLYDVEIHFEGDMPVFSLAALQPGRYPRVLRRGEVVHVD